MQEVIKDHSRPTEAVLKDHAAEPFLRSSSYSAFISS